MLHIKIHNCKLKDLNGIHHLSQLLAQYFPKPEQFLPGIHELLLNAIEHGNLGIAYEEKSALLRQDKWREVLEQRLAMPEYADKEIEIKITYDKHECRLTITDQGKGFAWKEYISKQPDMRSPNGRGLGVAFNCKFDRIMFNQAGNEVTCVVKYASWAMPEPLMLSANY